MSKNGDKYARYEVPIIKPDCPLMMTIPLSMPLTPTMMTPMTTMITQDEQFVITKAFTFVPNEPKIKTTNERGIVSLKSTQVSGHSFYNS